MWIKISLVMLILSLAQSKPMPQASYGNPGVVYAYSVPTTREFLRGMSQKISEILYQRKDKVIDVGESGKTIRRYVRIWNMKKTSLEKYFHIIWRQSIEYFCNCFVKGAALWKNKNIYQINTTSTKFIFAQVNYITALKVPYSLCFRHFQVP